MVPGLSGNALQLLRLSSTARPAAGTEGTLAKNAKSAKKASTKSPFNLGDLCVFARGITLLFATAYRLSLQLYGENLQLFRSSNAESVSIGVNPCLICFGWRREAVGRRG